MIWDKVVDSLHHHNSRESRNIREPRPSHHSLGHYYEDIDQKWKDLIIFFSKCQTYVGIGFN